MILIGTSNSPVSFFNYIMFDFGYANEQQKRAITATDGPVLITAGPGTGKTYTLVQRVLYLIVEKHIEPKHIFVATFTDKAAKELITRITNEMDANGIVAPINEMYIGTFHSICLRIIKEHIEYSKLRKNFRLLDAFDQEYLVYQNFGRFKKIEHFEEAYPNGSVWHISQQICASVNKLREEMVDYNALLSDDNSIINTIGSIYKEYTNLLDENNCLDFSSIQVEAYNLLKANPNVLDEIRNQINYIMVDEYQDTNYIQEQIVFLLNIANNVCVVGDDDQGLYRFRGATIRNILEFPQKFAKDECQVIPLTMNYRSDKDIVEFYNKWMDTTGNAKFNFEWDRYRYPKHIIANKKKDIHSPAVVRLSGIEDEKEWHEKVRQFIIDFTKSPHFSNLNQIAFLFNSVKTERATNLANYLEDHGINVYSPRSNMFFEREEIKMLMGFLLIMFPRYVQDLENGKHKFLNENTENYYVRCIQTATEYLTRPENKKVLGWIARHGKEHHDLTDNLDYAFSGLIYQLFAFDPFKTYLDVDISSGVIDTRPARNLSTFTQIAGRFEYLYNINVFTKQRINTSVERFFNTYIRLQYSEGISEYEDESEYAPSGCVSFMTIHQSKGMEFPVVFVDSLNNVPRNQISEVFSEIEDRYYPRTAFEPRKDIKYFDFWRLYYTAFSRAQNLLVLSCNETDRCPSIYFTDVYEDLPTCDTEDFDINEFDFASVKDVNLKQSFSFTSDITVYENCSLQYKFFKEFGFLPVRAGAQLFGRLVHETIEDVHKAVLRGEEDLVNPNNIIEWFNTNYEDMSKTEHSYLGEAQKQAALKQILRYAERNSNTWDSLQQAEVDVSLVRQDYIIEGRIDLIKGKGDTVEIVDFKSERKPDLVLDKSRLEQYRRQLHVYAYLVEQRHGKRVSKMNLYFTGEENGVPTVSYSYAPSAIEGTMASFDETVHRIMSKKYEKQSDKQKTCDNCDFRFYCKRNKTF